MYILLRYLLSVFVFICIIYLHINTYKYTNNYIYINTLKNTQIIKQKTNTHLMVYSKADWHVARWHVQYN